MNKTQLIPSETAFSIHPSTRIGQVSLLVANLDEQTAFYQKVLGFQIHWRDGRQAGLGAGRSDLLHLVEEPAAKRYANVTGLYHFAVVFPDRRELARAIGRLFALSYPNYPTDHIMTKTTYLNDPEGNGIELYAESPEDGIFTIENGNFVTRRADGSLSDGREALDVETLFGHLQPGDRLDAPITSLARLGHVHLHVRDVREAIDFYHGVLGFDLKGSSQTFQAAFVSAGGYHHHLGLNAWKGIGAPPPPPDALGLRFFSIELPHQKALDEVASRLDQAAVPSNRVENGLLTADPSQNSLLLKVKS